MCRRGQSPDDNATDLTGIGDSIAPWHVGKSPGNCWHATPVSRWAFPCACVWVGHAIESGTEAWVWAPVVAVPRAATTFGQAGKRITLRERRWAGIRPCRAQEMIVVALEPVQ